MNRNEPVRGSPERAHESIAPTEGRGGVLLIASEAQLRRALARILMNAGHEVLTAQDDEVAATLLTSAPVEAVLIDVTGRRDLLKERIEVLRSMRAGVEIVLLAAAAESEGFDDSGAYDVVLKPWATERTVSRCVERAIEHVRLIERLRRFARRLEQQERAGEMIGASRVMERVFSVARGAGPVTAPVLLIGGSGAGKEMLARAIHRHGPRANRPFVAVDCAAIPPTRLTLELFGTDAHTRGLVEAARGGTLFLADIEATSADTQARLVRLVQFGELHAGGASQAVDARLIASTSTELKPLVEAGKLRADLYYQLNVITIRIPPLRRRKDDIPLLAYHFLHQYGRRMGRAMQRISPEALRLLRDHPWPGNVRELEHAMERAVAMSRGDAVLPGDLAFLGETPREVDDEGEEREVSSVALPGSLLELPFAEAKLRAVAAFEQHYVSESLRRAGGNVSEAARLAGLDRSNFRRILKKAPKRRSSS